jgi:hypothetical protein
MPAAATKRTRKVATTKAKHSGQRATPTRRNASRLAVQPGAAGKPIALALNVIDEDAHQPRGEESPGFSAKSLREMAESINARSVKTPISVKHNGRPARLILDRRPPAAGYAWLKFEHDDREFKAKLSSVQLVAVLEG